MLAEWICVVVASVLASAVMKTTTREDQVESASPWARLPAESRPSLVERSILLLCYFAVIILIYLMVSSNPGPEMYNGIL